MKRIGNIYRDIVTIENCKGAILQASVGKRTRADVKMIVDNLDAYAARLAAMLDTQTYTPAPYTLITVKDGPSGKVREIQVPKFWLDQCVHHALMNVLGPILDRRMYHWSCGSRKGKGIAHAKKGVERATLHDQKHAKYAVKMDVRKCYPSIKSPLLYAAFERLLKDRRTLWLIKVLIFSSEGLPIGNYTSAWFCNFYLTAIDRRIKDKHHIRHYIRYIDDMVLIDSNKRKLVKAVLDVSEALTALGLSLHENWNIFRIRRQGGGNRHRPVDFVGYRFCVGYTTLRRRNALALMRQSRKVQKLEAQGRAIPFRLAAGFLSRAGQLLHCKAHGLKKKYVDTVSTKKLKDVVKNESHRKRIAAGRVQY